MKPFRGNHRIRKVSKVFFISYSEVFVLQNAFSWIQQVIDSFNDVGRNRVPPERLRENCPIQVFGGIPTKSQSFSLATPPPDLI